MSNNIKITYETLFDINRREKHRSELQQLEPSFYVDVISYLSDKLALLKQQEQKTDLLSAAQREQMRNQVNNIRKLIIELFERRQEKIISMAVNKSKIDMAGMDTTMMLAEEKEFLNAIEKLLMGYRNGVLLSILALKNPEFTAKAEELHAVSVTEAKDEKQRQETQYRNENDSTLRLIFLGNVDQFIGPDLSPVGPFRVDEEAELPRMVAEVLLRKGVAEKI